MPAMVAGPLLRRNERTEQLWTIGQSSGSARRLWRQDAPTSANGGPRTGRGAGSTSASTGSAWPLSLGRRTPRMSDKSRPAAGMSGAGRAGGATPDDTRRERAVELVRRTGRFFREHPDLMEFIFSAVEGEARQGRRVSLQWGLERARAHDFVGMEPGHTCCNNDYGAPLARVFCREFPDLAPMVERRRSSVDMLSGEEFMAAWSQAVA